MLEHLSPKFKMPPMEREPRAALILNRFTRSLNIMFATNAVRAILGLRPDQIKDTSFYRCIQENCLPDAIECLERAKANDSIAYLRFSFRDPREPDALGDDEMDAADVEGRVSGSTSDSEDGGAQLRNGGGMDLDPDDSDGRHIKAESDAEMVDAGADPLGTANATAAASESDLNAPPHQAPLAANPRRPRRQQPAPAIELEAVVSCTSDGLVVVLRKARPPIPAPHPPLLPIGFANGLFAAPWAQQPIAPYVPPDMLYTFQSPLLPQHMPLRESVMKAGGPPLDQLMRSIRDVAVFAWALVGINGNLATYGQGMPRGDAQPPDGLPVWDPAAGIESYQGPENQAALRWAQVDERAAARARTQGGSYRPVTQSLNHRPTPVARFAPPLPVWPGAPGHTYAPTYDHSQHHHVHFHQQPQQHQQQRPPQVPYYGGPAQEPWPEASAAPPYTPSYGVTTTQPESPKESTAGGHRYPWQ